MSETLGIGDYIPDPGHFGPDGPVAVVEALLRSTLEPDGSLEAGWGYLDATLRLCLAQSWVYANCEVPAIAAFDRDEMAEYLAAGPSPGDELWDAFAAVTLGEIRDAWGPVYARQLGAASRPRLLAPDLELVIFIPTDGKVILIDQPTLLEQLQFIVRRTVDRWLIAAFSAFMPVPGWPPMTAPR